MTEHYSKQTVSVSAFCSKCNKSTEHRVDHGRKGPCLRCVEKLQADFTYHEQEKRKEQRQGVLFRSAF
jgi:hypothetical protein